MPGEKPGKLARSPTAGSWRGHPAAGGSVYQGRGGRPILPPMIAYQPSRWLAGGHRMTFYAAMRRRRFLDLPPSDERYFETAHDARVLARCHWQSERRDHPTLVLLHGLEGSANAHYMRGIAGKAFDRGFNSVRLNQRNCGRTEHLSVGLYHSGLIEDPTAVIRELIEVDGLRSIAVTGYSLGGNIALRLAGVCGESPPRELHSISAVSPPLDLARAANAIEWKQNWFYQWNFLRDLRRRIRLKARLFPDVYTADGRTGTGRRGGSWISLIAAAARRVALPAAVPCPLPRA
jgi:predicted alpha/beta-fold hydrolase